MKKFFKILIYVILVYFSVGIIFSLVFTIYNFPKEKAQRNFNFRSAEICYECIKGIREGDCPYIVDPYFEDRERKLSYPNSQMISDRPDEDPKKWYSFNRSIQEGKEYSDEELVENIFCYDYHWNAVNSGVPLIKISEQNLFFTSFQNAFNTFIFATLGLPVCYTFGCQM